MNIDTTSSGDKISGSKISLKRQLVEATDAVRKKFNSIKSGRVENQLALEKIYEPITKPLKVISSAAIAKPQMESPQLKMPTKRTHSTGSISGHQSLFKTTPDRHTDDDDSNDRNTTTQDFFMETPSTSTLTTPGSESSFLGDEEIVKEHIENLTSGNSKYDTIYGIRIDPHTNKLQMGNSEVRFSNGNITLWCGKKKLGVYPGSPRLYDIIFLKSPPILNSDEVDISDEESQIYGEILNRTKAPYKHYDLRNGLRNSNSKKFHKIIKPLASTALRSRSGLGLAVHLPTQKLYTNRSVDYVYWNKPKELVDRLRLLWSAKIAGNNNVNNEIVNLVQELREEKIVY